jgi:hypothetical protein
MKEAVSHLLTALLYSAMLLKEPFGCGYFDEGSERTGYSIARFWVTASIPRGRASPRRGVGSKAKIPISPQRVSVLVLETWVAVLGIGGSLPYLVIHIR